MTHSSLVRLDSHRDRLHEAARFLLESGADPNQTFDSRSPLFGAESDPSPLSPLYGAAGVNVAHELIHRLDKPFDKTVGKWLLALTWDTGFAIEHVHGHHRTVGTPADPATAKRGEYIVLFVFRSTIGQWLSARRTEAERLKRKGEPNTILTNRFWRGQLMTLVVVAFYVAFLGPIGILFSLYSGFIGKIYLEVVNYIEHYGLLREKINGEYGPCTPQHSWNSNKLVTNIGLFNLQRHSDHHANPSRPYEMLRHIPDSPQHPTGYAAMIVLALVPPLWFRVMDPRVVALYGGDVSKANLHPGKAEQLKRRFQSR